MSNVYIGPYNGLLVTGVSEHSAAGGTDEEVEGDSDWA